MKIKITKEKQNKIQYNLYLLKINLLKFFKTYKIH